MLRIHIPASYGSKFAYREGLLEPQRLLWRGGPIYKKSTASVSSLHDVSDSRTIVFL